MRCRLLAIVLVGSAVAALAAASPSAGQVVAPPEASGPSAAAAGPNTGGHAFAGTGGGRVVVPNDGGPEGATSPESGGESIVGADGRVRVTPTTGYPSRAIGQIEFDQVDPGYICTGWFIDPNTILTSGHCLHDGVGTWSTNVDFFPGRDRGIENYPMCNATELWTTTQWRNAASAEHDFGMVQLDCNVGDTVGWFGYRSLADFQLLGRAITLRGYPGDAPVYGEMQTMSDQIRALVNKSLRYEADTAGGQSGSPVYEDLGCGGGPCGLAVHSYGCPGDTPCPAPNNFNSGPRLTDSRVDTIYDYTAENDPHADLSIRRSTGSFKGNNNYNRSGRDQSFTSRNLPAGATRNFVVRIQNDGTGTDTITVQGQGSSSHFRIRYFDGPTNVTAAVTAGTYKLTNLAAGTSGELRVEMKVENSAPNNATVTATVTATSTAGTYGYQDVVKSTVSR